MPFHIDSKTLCERALNLRSFATPMIWVETEEIRRGTEVVTSAFAEANVQRKKEGKSTPTICEWDVEAGLHQHDWAWVKDSKNTKRPKGKAMPLFKTPDALVDPTKAGERTHITDSRTEMLRALLDDSPKNSIFVLADLGDFLNVAQSDPSARNQINTLLYKMTEPMIYNEPRRFATKGEIAESLKRKLVTIVVVGPKPADGVLTDAVKNNITWLRLGRPTKEEHAAFILKELDLATKEQVELSKKNFKVSTNEELAALAGACLMGLTAYEGDSAYFYSLKTCNGLDYNALSSFRREMINSTAGLTLRDYDPMFAMDRVKGLDNAEEIIDSLMNKELPKEDQAKSLLFVGPPGVGKTMLGRAFAQKLQVPFISIEIERMLGGLVGDSERNLNRALEVIDSLGPCVGFIDEADKQLAGTSDENQGGGGDLTKRMGGILLRWEQDRKSEAIIIKTANRTHNFSSEMLRRCDIILMIDFPHLEDRKAIITQYAEDRDLKFDPKTFQNLALRTRYWSGDEIKKLVARIRAFGNNPDGISRAFEYIRPKSTTHREDIQKIRAIGRELGVLASMEDVDNEKNDEVPPMVAQNRES